MSFFSPSAILEHCQTYIPRLSNKFSSNGLVSGEIIDGSPQVLRISDTAHGLTAGRQIVLFGGQIDNDITAVSSVVDPLTNVRVLTFTTAKEHDLTLDYTPEVTLSGFTDSGLNTTHDIINVPSRTSFEIEYATEPTLNGNEVLREEWEIGVDGLFTIDRIIDTNTYEIDLTDKPDFTPQTLPTLYRAKGFRMHIVADAQKAESVYTKQSDSDTLYLFVIMGDSAASKDRKISSDATKTSTSQDGDRVLMVNTFSLLVIFPTKEQMAASTAVNAAWDEILKVMLATASGIRFDDFGNTRYLTTLIDHGQTVYVNGYYGHVYTFEYSYEVTYEDTFLTRFIESRAFRDNVTELGDIEGSLDLDGGEELTE